MTIPWLSQLIRLQCDKIIRTNKFQHPSGFFRLARDKAGGDRYTESNCSLKKCDFLQEGV